MPYTDEQWEYFQTWQSFSKEKDLLYSKQEFDFFINRLKQNSPFSLVRFGEGESRIVLKQQKLNRSELSFDPDIEANMSYVNDLKNAATIKHNNYFVGIQSYTFKPAEQGRPDDEFIKQRQAVVNLGNLSQSQYTCSRVFCNFYSECNSTLLNLLKQKKVYLVCSENASPTRLGINPIRIWKIHQKDAWKKNIDLYKVVQEEFAELQDCVLLCCAGFFGNILISKLKHEHNYLINVGSVFDPLLFGKTTRSYQRGTG